MPTTKSTRESLAAVSWDQADVDPPKILTAITAAKK
jgi:hypothetical protein